MRLFLFNYRCAECNAITKIPGLPDMAYGEFIMFNDLGEWVYLNSFQAPTFDEFESFFKEIKHFYPINEKTEVEIFQSIFSITCDLSPDGSRYSILLSPRCHSCGSRKMASWGRTNPVEFVDNIKQPTHEEWNKLNDCEKKMRMRKEINKILRNCTPPI